MPNPWSEYDNWLVAPMERQIEEADRYIDWCEEHNISPDDPDAETLYNDYIDSQWEPPEPDDDYDEDFEYDR